MHVRTQCKARGRCVGMSLNQFLIPASGGIEDIKQQFEFTAAFLSSLDKLRSLARSGAQKSTHKSGCNDINSLYCVRIWPETS